MSNQGTGTDAFKKRPCPAEKGKMYRGGFAGTGSSVQIAKKAFIQKRAKGVPASGNMGLGKSAMMTQSGFEGGIETKKKRVF